MTINLYNIGTVKISDLLKNSENIQTIALTVEEHEPSLSSGPGVDKFFQEILKVPGNAEVVQQMRDIGMSEEHIKSMVYNAPVVPNR